MYGVKPSTFLPAAEIQQIPVVRSLQVSQHHRLCLVSFYQQLNWSDTQLPPEASNSLNLQSLSTHNLVVFEKHLFFPLVSIFLIWIYSDVWPRVFSNMLHLQLLSPLHCLLWCYLLSHGPRSKCLWDGAERYGSFLLVVMRHLPRIISMSEKD